MQCKEYTGQTLLLDQTFSTTLLFIPLSFSSYSEVSCAELQVTLATILGENIDLDIFDRG